MTDRARELLAAEELKPCPFCGSGGEYRQTRAGTWVIECGNTAEGEGCLVEPGSFGATDQEAARRWNTRAIEAALSLPADKDVVERVARQAYEAGPPAEWTEWEDAPKWDDLSSEMRESCFAFTRNVLAAIAAISSPVVTRT